MFIQSILFFILGVATIVFFLTLLSPIIWKRMLFLARKTLKADIPFSLKEVEIQQNFLKAQHAVELTRINERCKLLEKISDTQKIKLDASKEQLFKLSQLENRTAQMEEQITYYKNLLDKEKKLVDCLYEEQKKNSEDLHCCLITEKNILIDIAAYEQKMKNLKKKIDQLTDLYQKTKNCTSREKKPSFTLTSKNENADGSLETLHALRQDINAFTNDVLNDFKKVARTQMPTAQIVQNKS